jgi:branched-chain amino acid transport system substrate-binding protein
MRQFRFVTSVLAITLCISSAAAQSNNLRVGVILPLSGPVAEYGVAARNGFFLAKAGSGKVKYIFEDSRGAATDAVTIFKRFQNIEKVDLAYVWGSAESSAVAPVAELAKIPTFLITSDPSIAGVRSNNIIRFYNSGERYSKLTMEFIKARNISKIGLLKTEIPYFNALQESLENELGPNQSISLAFVFSPGDLDFKSAIARLRTSSYDALGIFLLPAQVSQFYIQAKNLGLNTNTFGSDVFESSSVIAEAAGSMKGAVFATDDVKDLFRQRYVASFSNETHISYAANAFEFATICENQLSELGRQNSLSILKVISEMTSVRGEAIDFSKEESKTGVISFTFPVLLRTVE